MWADPEGLNCTKRADTKGKFEFDVSVAKDLLSSWCQAVCADIAATKWHVLFARSGWWVPGARAQENLENICRLLISNNSMAIKAFARGSDPKTEYRWLLVGWDLTSGPQRTNAQGFNATL